MEFIAPVTLLQKTPRPFSTYTVYSPAHMCTRLGDAQMAALPREWIEGSCCAEVWQQELHLQIARHVGA